MRKPCQRCDRRQVSPTLSALTGFLLGKCLPVGELVHNFPDDPAVLDVSNRTRLEHRLLNLRKYSTEGVS
jgi:hypothetical protein